MIRSLLIANRGEIACRVIRTARAMGIRSIAVYSDADAGAMHVRMADAAVAIGPAPARESYLAGDRIIAAALEAGAEAVHPGYGFLSENAAFARAVMAAGLIWVGPDPRGIEAMGRKDAAKALMHAAGVPVTPGYLGEDQSTERLRAEAQAIGYPVLIKAVAGGGGKGMRRVDRDADFMEMLHAARREAAAAFGDDRVLIETYVAGPRHIEVQVFGDGHGNIVHLFERDCSLQRRHQKVIEEAPAPGMDGVTRAAICDAAVRAARAVDYVGAGTVEFIANAASGLSADRIWFMEMNTRLQVEHPVTEAITGVDLVEWQLRVASGAALPLRQDELTINGWGMEARLYAEDPAHGFLPSPGRLDHLRLPDGVRVDSGVQQGDPISQHYDPMIAKLIAHAPDREGAASALANACAGIEAWPVRTNAAFLARMLDDRDFVAGRIDTGLIERRGEAWTQTPADAAIGTRGLAALGPGEIGASELTGFRLNAPPRRTATVHIDGSVAEAPLTPRDAGIAGTLPLSSDRIIVFARGAAHLVSLASRPRGGASAGSGAIVAPMPGRVIAVDVMQGDAVRKGQRLLSIEAMKMEQALTAPFDGVVADVKAVAGDQVSEGALLVRVEAEN